MAPGWVEAPQMYYQTDPHMYNSGTSKEHVPTPTSLYSKLDTNWFELSQGRIKTIVIQLTIYRTYLTYCISKVGYTINKIQYMDVNKWAVLIYGVIIMGVYIRDSMYSACMPELELEKMASLQAQDPFECEVKRWAYC